MPRLPKVAEVTPGEYKIIRTIVSEVWKAHKYDVNANQFELAVRRKVLDRMKLGDKLPPVFCRTISALRYEMTDLRTPDEMLGITHKPRKPGIGIRVKREKPKKLVFVNKGTVEKFDSHKNMMEDSTAKLGTDLYPTFGPSSDFQIFTQGKPEYQPPDIYEGPLLKPFEFMPSIFKGPMTLEPTGIQPPISGWKEVDWQEITKNRLKTWAGRDRNDYGGQQNGIMGGVSAANEARYAFSISSGVSEEVKKLEENDWEWLHLVAFSMGGIGNVPQQAQNLVAGTYHSNTEMMLYENSMKKLIDETGESLWIKVSAHLIMHTHVADQINYVIERRPTGKQPITLTIETRPLSFNTPASGMEVIVYEGMKKYFYG